MSEARYVVVACTAKDRWFDLDSERGPGSPNTHARLARGVNSRPANGKKADNPNNNYGSMPEVETAGAPPLDCWAITGDEPLTLDEEPPMSEARYIVSDVYDAMAKMPDSSVDVVITSPPFLALRSYLPADHPDKAKEIGSEPTPAAFLTTLLALTREWRRILTPTGSLCVELGDTYAGSGGAGGDYGEGGLRSGQPVFRNRNWKLSGVLDKSLCGIPSAYQLSLIYGWNMLNPAEKCDPMRVRNLIVWHRPNPPVGALGDKVRPSTSYVTVACTAKDRWFDLDSERGPSVNPIGIGVRPTQARVNGSDDLDGRSTLGPYTVEMQAAGAPPLDCWFDTTEQDVWTIPTAPYAGAHYATFPPALPRRLINLMCPRQVCVVCGEPRRRITAVEYEPHGERRDEVKGERRHVDWQANGEHAQHMEHGRATKNVETLGWSDCACKCSTCWNRAASGGIDDHYPAPFICEHHWRRGIVCDPFAGSGTTLQAASELGRDSIGIDLDPRNLELARQRLGMFLVEEDEVPA